MLVTCQPSITLIIFGLLQSHFLVSSKSQVLVVLSSTAITFGLIPDCFFFHHIHLCLERWATRDIVPQTLLELGTPRKGEEHEIWHAPFVAQWSPVADRKDTGNDACLYKARIQHMLFSKKGRSLSSLSFRCLLAPVLPVPGLNAES